jgi:hypothetical protein
MANKQSERKKKRKQRKKRQIGTKSDPTTIHAPPRKKKRDVKMNLMMSEIMIQIIEASRTRCSKTVNTCKARIKIFFSFFFYLYESKNTSSAKQYKQKNITKSQPNP